MGGDWQQVSLGELVEIKHGFAFKGEFVSDAPNGDILLTPGNFAIGGGFKGDKLKYYHGPVPSGFVLSGGDLVVTMTDLSKQADTLGYAAVVPARSDGRRFLHNQRIGKVLLREGRDIDLGFLHYLMRSEPYRNEVLASATGTTVKHTAPKRIEKFQFPLPPRTEQRAISNVLGTLDRRIDLSRRMSQTLEAMARAVFRSWFVDFDPVRAKAEGRDPRLPLELAGLFPGAFEDSEIGEVPRGWKTVPLPEVIEVNPSRRLRRGMVAPYLDMANTPVRGHAPDRVIQRPYGSGTRFINGDTLVARITPCLENGKTAYVDFLPDRQVGWGSTEFIVLRPKSPLPPEFAYCLARSREFREFAVLSMTGSSGRQRVPADSLNHYLVAVPPETGVADAFARQVEPLFARASAAAAESRTLTALRDTLLPKLVSGELRVDEAERLIGVSV